MTWLQTQELFPKNVFRKPEEESETSETGELVAQLMNSIAATDAALADLKADAAEIREKPDDPQDSILEDYLAACGSSGVKPDDRLVKSYQELELDRLKEALLNQETEALIQRAKKLVGKKSDSSDVEYFKSEADRIIFFLLELDGEARAKALGITKAHFRSKITASGWRDGLVKIIHPDICNHPNANKALATLNGLYGQMKRTAK
jgi:hypothetical protein